MCTNSSFVVSEIYDVAWQIQYYSCPTIVSDIYQITAAAVITFYFMYILFAFSAPPGDLV